jgi:hypothetical protein
MSDIQLGTIDFTDVDGHHVASWRGAADAETTFLCSVKASAIADSEVLAKFHALAAAVAGHVAFGSTAVAAAPSGRWYDSLPCKTCQQPQAADVLHACAQVTELAELQLSPGGLPVQCCRVHVVAAMGIPDLPPAAPPARRSRRWF